MLIKKDMYVKCPSCNGSGTAPQHTNGVFTHKMCLTCKGEGGHTFSYQTLDTMYVKYRDDLRKLLYRRK